MGAGRDKKEQERVGILKEKTELKYKSVSRKFVKIKITKNRRFKIFRFHLRGVCNKDLIIQSITKRKRSK